MCVKQTYALQLAAVQPTLSPRWPTVGRLAYTVVLLVINDYIIIIIIMARRQLRSVATTLHDDRDPVPSSTPV